VVGKNPKTLDYQNFRLSNLWIIELFLISQSIGYFKVA